MSRRRVITGAAIVGAAGGVATAIGFAREPAQAAFSYLTAWTFALSIALGALIFLMIGHAVGARWTIVFQRITEAIVGGLPVLAVLFVPIAASVAVVYPWASPEAAASLARGSAEAAAKLAHKAPYLDVTFWLIRAAGFLALWIAVGELLARWGRRAAIDPAAPVRARVLSAAALPAIGLSLTFAAFDWLMSLTPLWYSTMFGLAYFAGGFVAAMSLIAAIAWAVRRVPEAAAAIRGGHTGALGRMMLAFLGFWAYLELFQGLIIWIADKPDEVPWYVARGAGAWGGVLAVLAIGHFALPMLPMLSRALKRRPAVLAILGGWIVVMHYVDVYWLVMPVAHRALAIHWLDIAAPCAVLGITTAVAMARPRARAVIASDDPRFAAAIAYEGS